MLLSSGIIRQSISSYDVNSMGTAWCATQAYPWEQGLYVGGMETAKVNLTLRIYSNAWQRLRWPGYSQSKCSYPDRSLRCQYDGTLQNDAARQERGRR